MMWVQDDLAFTSTRNWIIILLHTLQYVQLVVLFIIIFLN